MLLVYAQHKSVKDQADIPSAQANLPERLLAAVTYIEQVYSKMLNAACINVWKLSFFNKKRAVP